jgi:bacterial leucyl aminopeptidase
LASPHRAIRFGLFNAEEQGRIGSLHYASDQRLAGAPILAVYCMDMIGFNGMPERDFAHSTELRGGACHCSSKTS